MYKAPVKRSYLSSPTMSVDLDIPPTNMNYVLIFAQLYLLLYETQKEKTQQKKLAYVWACQIKVGEGIERVQYFKSKGNVVTMLKQSSQEIKPT